MFGSLARQPYVANDVYIAPYIPGDQQRPQSRRRFQGTILSTSCDQVVPQRDYRRLCPGEDLSLHSRVQRGFVSLMGALLSAGRRMGPQRYPDRDVRACLLPARGHLRHLPTQLPFSPDIFLFRRKPPVPQKLAAIQPKSRRSQATDPNDESRGDRILDS